MKSHKVLEFSQYFEKVADFNFQKILTTYKSSIQKELANTIQSVNKLYAESNANGNSPGLESIDNICGELGTHLAYLNIDNASATLSDMKKILSRASFYTSRQNAGTGYEAITHKGGNNSPAASLQRVINLVNKLEEYSLYFDKLKNNKVQLNS